MGVSYNIWFFSYLHLFFISLTTAGKNAPQHCPLHSEINRKFDARPAKTSWQEYIICQWMGWFWVFLFFGMHEERIQKRKEFQMCGIPPLKLSFGGSGDHRAARCHLPSLLQKIQPTSLTKKWGFKVLRKN